MPLFRRKVIEEVNKALDELEKLDEVNKADKAEDAILREYHLRIKESVLQKKAEVEAEIDVILRRRGH